MSKTCCWKGTGLSYDKNFACSNNPKQNIWNKTEKSSETGEEKITLVSIFACFLTAIAKV